MTYAVVGCTGTGFYHKMYAKVIKETLASTGSLNRKQQGKGFPRYFSLMAFQG